MTRFLIPLVCLALSGCASAPSPTPSASEPPSYYTDEAGRIFEVRGETYELIFVPAVPVPNRWTL